MHVCSIELINCLLGRSLHKYIPHGYNPQHFHMNWKYNKSFRDLEVVVKANVWLNGRL